MYYSFLVKKDEALEHLVNVNCDETLWNLAEFFYQRVERAILNVLEHNIEMLF